MPVDPYALVRALVRAELAAAQREPATERPPVDRPVPAAADPTPRVSVPAQRRRPTRHRLRHLLAGLRTARRS